MKEAKAVANTYGMLPLIKEPVGEGDEPLYPGASLTKAQSLLMNAIFFLRNGLKKKTVQDFLTIYNAQFPHMSPSTNYLFEKAFAHTEKTVQHFYCVGCKGYLGKNSDLEDNAVCDDWMMVIA